jgi:hypothetical protein
MSNIYIYILFVLIKQGDQEKEYKYKKGLDLPDRVSREGIFSPTSCNTVP